MLKKQERFQVSNLTLQLKELEKEEQAKPKATRWKEITNRTDTHETENKKTEKSMKPKAGSLKRSAKLVSLELDGLRKKINY